MTNATHASDAARESARQCDGKFGAQAHGLPTRGLSLEDHNERRHALRVQRKGIDAELLQLETDLICELISEDRPTADAVEVTFIRTTEGGQLSMPIHVAKDATWVEGQMIHGDDDGVVLDRINILNREQIIGLHNEAGGSHNGDPVYLRLDLKERTWLGRESDVKAPGYPWRKL